MVDFGLAHKAPVPLKTQKSETLDKAGKKDTSESTPSQLKRKCRKTSLENEVRVLEIHRCWSLVVWLNSSSICPTGVLSFDLTLT